MRNVSFHSRVKILEIHIPIEHHNFSKKFNHDDKWTQEYTRSFLSHSRMRRQSSCLVTATNENSAIGVLFDVDYDVIVKKPCFQRGSTLKFLKNFRTFSLLKFGQRHGVIISLQPIRNILEKLQETSKLVCLLVFAWAVVPGLSCPCLLLFQCLLTQPVLVHSPCHQQQQLRRKTHGRFGPYRHNLRAGRLSFTWA